MGSCDRSIAPPIYERGTVAVHQHAVHVKDHGGRLTVCSLNQRRLRGDNLFAIPKESSRSPEGCTSHSCLYMYFHHVVGISFERSVENLKGLHFTKFPALRVRITSRLGNASREEINARRRKLLSSNKSCPASVRHNFRTGPAQGPAHHIPYY